MQFFRRKFVCLFSTLAVLALAREARADASLLFDLGASSSVFVAPGDSFSFDVYLTANALDEMVAYDFYLQASGAAGTDGWFTITNRLGNTLDFGDLNSSDEAVASPSPGSTLQPRNGASLGATVSDVFEPVTGSSLYYLGTYTFSVSGSALPGPTTYFITSVSTISGSGVGIWTDGAFEESPFAAGGSFSVTIIPEPTMLGLIAVGGLVFLRRRRA